MGIPPPPLPLPPLPMLGRCHSALAAVIILRGAGCLVSCGRLAGETQRRSRGEAGESQGGRGEGEEDGLSHLDPLRLSLARIRGGILMDRL